MMNKYKPESEEITPIQWKIIDFIFEHFDADFTGKTREDAHKFINYWALDVAAIKREDEWSVLNGN